MNTFIAVVLRFASAATRRTLLLGTLMTALLLSLVYQTPVQAAPAASDITRSEVSDMSSGVDATRTGKWIEVILSQQRLNAWQNGRIVMSSPISSGVRWHPTLRGTFKIYARFRTTRMRGPGYDLPGVPYTMFYSGNYAIHGAYWHNNFGHPMSHGCINLPVAFARSLYLWASNGTTVVIR
jgi:lipoprotein-anchoring transpeptidase ErfK/SrfK